jgi:C-8 sterol isomerase
LLRYLIIFGSAVGTEGHTGRHTADDYFHILSGQQSVYEPGELVKTDYNPGDVNLMSRGVARHYMMAPETWALEYARGKSRFSALIHCPFFLVECAAD